MSRIVRVDGGQFRYVQNISVGRHKLRADEPVDAGGQDAGPGPYEMLLAGLGACTNITVQMYAERKQWPLKEIRVDLSYAKVRDDSVAKPEVMLVDEIEMEIEFVGDLTDEQRERLMQIANKCPLHRTLRSAIKIRTRPAKVEPWRDPTSEDHTSIRDCLLSRARESTLPNAIPE